MQFSTVRSIYFIGIEGISMHGLATFCRAIGKKVNGSDLRTTGHQAENIAKLHPKPDLIVTSAAITPQSPGWIEVIAAEQYGLTIKDRGWLIGELMRQKNTYGIAIAGMHGKSTTTAMLGKILVEANLDPLILCGAVMPEYGDSVKIPDRISKDKKYTPTIDKPFYIVAEACEYERQFLKFVPKAVIITNIDKEHLDTYPRGLPQIIRAFRDFVALVPPDGLIVMNGDDSNCRAIAKSAYAKVKFFSAKSIWPGLRLKVPGQFNKLNAGAAARLAHEIDIDHQTIKKGLNSFGGLQRRLELKGRSNVGSLLYDDYAHHPTEIKVTLNALRLKYPRHRIIVAFQAHQFLRTRRLVEEFVHAFDMADILIVAPIFAVAGRDDTTIITTQKFFDHIRHTQKYLVNDPSYREITKLVKSLIRPNDILITMGATPIYKVLDELIDKP